MTGTKNMNFGGITMKTFYVTFSKNSNLRKQVVKVSAMDHKDAIRTTKEIYGNDWETIYTEKEYRQLNDNGGITMTTYKIIIDGKETEKWNSETGCEFGKRMAHDFKQVTTIETEKEITRQDILKAVCEMLYCDIKNYTEEDLFDGNDKYFTLGLLEDEEGYPLEKDKKEGYLSTYFIDVMKTEAIKASDIK